MSQEQKPKRVMPKGGRKGGSVFPRVTLAESVKAAKRLVSKTHTGPQEQSAIFAVVGARSGVGEVRISALRQYGFLTGDKASKFSASDLAKKINAAPEEEISPLLRAAALNPQIFSKMFNVFHGDEVTRGKLKQKAAELNVHPEAADDFVDVYISAMTLAGLATLVGDKVQHLSRAEIEESASIAPNATDIDEEAGDETEAVVIDGQPDVEQNAKADQGKRNTTADDANNAGTGPRAVFQVSISLDSSLDTEKLEKQLALLKRYGAI